MTEISEKTSDPNEALSHALEILEVEKQIYQRERELLEEIEKDHQLKWKMLMRRVGRI